MVESLAGDMASLYPQTDGHAALRFAVYLLFCYIALFGTNEEKTSVDSRPGNGLKRTGKNVNILGPSSGIIAGASPETQICATV